MTSLSIETMASNEEIYEQIRTMRKDLKDDLKADDKRKILNWRVLH